MVREYGLTTVGKAHQIFATLAGNIKLCCMNSSLLVLVTLEHAFKLLFLATLGSLGLGNVLGWVVQITLFYISDTHS